MQHPHYEERGHADLVMGRHCSLVDGAVASTSDPSQLIPDPGTVVIFRQILEISWYLPRIRVEPEIIKSCDRLLVVPTGRVGDAGRI